MECKVEAQGTHAGFVWTAVVNPLGIRCGYVLLAPGHPWYDKDYAEIDVQIHGGLSFGRHTTAETYPWLPPGFNIGFDCGHAWDQPDYDEMSRDMLLVRKQSEKLGRAMASALLESLGLKKDFEPLPMPEGVLRRTAYVESQCKQLAAECREVADLQASLESAKEGEC